jgi:hypothetical protein
MFLRHELGSIVAALALVSPAPGRAEPTASIPEDRMVCKYQAVTGSRFKTKICKTEKQWEEIREQNRRDLKETIDRPVIDTRRGG